MDEKRYQRSDWHPDAAVAQLGCDEEGGARECLEGGIKSMKSNKKQQESAATDPAAVAMFDAPRPKPKPKPVAAAPSSGEMTNASQPEPKPHHVAAYKPTPNTPPTPKKALDQPIPAQAVARSLIREQSQRQQKKMRLPIPFDDDKQKQKLVKEQQKNISSSSLSSRKGPATTIKISVTESDQTRDPILVSFPNGLPLSLCSNFNCTSSKVNNDYNENFHSSSSCQDEMIHSPPLFQWYKQTNTKDSTHKIIVKGSDNSCLYEGSINKNKQSWKMYVGIYDKITNELLIQPCAEHGSLIPVHQSVKRYDDDLGCIVHSDSDDDNNNNPTATRRKGEFDGLTYAEKKSIVFNTFGSSKKKKHLRSLEASQVKHWQLSPSSFDLGAMTTTTTTGSQQQQDSNQFNDKESHNKTSSPNHNMVKTKQSTQKNHPPSVYSPPQTFFINWAQCNSCQKWRILPSMVVSTSLPKTFCCADNIWDNKRNTCDVPEKELDYILYGIGLGYDIMKNHHYLMLEIERLIFDLKNRHQARDKKLRNTFNTQLYFMMGRQVNTLGLCGFTDEHNFLRGKGVFNGNIEGRLNGKKREIWQKCKELLCMFDVDYAKNNDFCVAINIMNSTEGHYINAHKDSQDISFQYAFACGTYFGGHTRVFSTDEKRCWDVDYKYKICKFDGRNKHLVQNFYGERIAVVYFKLFDRRKIKKDPIFNEPKIILG